MAQFNGTNPFPTHGVPSNSGTLLDEFFPGFGQASAFIGQFVAGNLSGYAQLLCLCSVLSFVGRYINILVRWIRENFTSTIHLQRSSESYDMLLGWISLNDLGSLARSSVARVGAEGKTPPDHFIAKKKPLHFSPWKASFLFWYNSNLLLFRSTLKETAFRQEEEISLTCLGRTSKVIQAFLAECRLEYLQRIENKTTIFEHSAERWRRTTAINARPMSTVLISDHEKQSLISDVDKFLAEETQKWYSARAIPYRRGYLLYGPPGTGKSSLSLSIAGHFGLDIYVLSISSVDDETLKTLFAQLPQHCVVLLEDVDATGASNCRGVKAHNAATPKAVTLSGLLNALDGVASQVGRVLIMTTNHIEKLDEALIRPGRVDKVRFQLADHDVLLQLFHFVFASTVKHQSSDTMERLADDFAKNIPTLSFSPADVLSFLLEHRDSPSSAVIKARSWATRALEERVSDSACLPEDTKSNGH
ncbi:putative mitochondrial chaperone bcs1 [Truncatella angustata]|uniref:Mitochondrial chaperone bcs1 n=1 Tax=Truncatella angustata TaxID=152316 RepID=A0A9P8RH09_9PEZI|nr:putative mitochondrial chaperone bcs1 [Truncatella angustata]KAH6645644.1 putative mitochondrial chaperone bcs1 [Truncatella angustata]